MHNQFDLAASDGKRFEPPGFLAEVDYSARSTVRTSQLFWLDAAVKNGLSAKKSVLLYCTPRTPNV